MDLSKLLLNLSGLSSEEQEKLGREWYAKLYLTSGRFGIHQLHDGEQVIFHEDRFDHAFFTSSNWQKHPEKKDLLAQERIRRIQWIAAVIAGNVPNSACWDAPGPGGRILQNNKLYVVYAPAYVVWLEPRAQQDKVQWKFSSAYDANPRYIRDRTKLATCIWRPKN